MSCISHDVLRVFEVEEVATNFSEAEALLLKLTRRSLRNDVPNVIFMLNLYLPSPPKKFSFANFKHELDLLVDDVIGAHSFFIGGDFNAHVKVGSLVPVRDRDFTLFVDHLLTDGFEMFPARDSTIPTFISAKGATMIDFTFARGLQLKAADSSIIAYEDVGHRVLAVDLELPQLVVNHLKPRQSHRRHLASPPPPPRGFFSSLCRSYGWHGPLEILKLGVSSVFASLLLYLQSFLYVVRPPPAGQEGWHRYLNFAELRELTAAEAKVADLARTIAIGDSTEILWKERRALVLLVADLRKRAAQRFGDTVANSKKDHTLLWKTVKNFRLDPDASQGLPVDALCDHFSKLFNRESDMVSLPFVYSFTPCVAGLDARFVMSELDRALADLKPGTAPGPNGVGNDVLLDLAKLPGFKRLLLNLYNGCLEGGSIPKAWSHCEMFILYKGKGDPLLPSSYRAIALLDAFVKLYERLLCSRLAAWASVKDIIPASQFGFRSGSSTLDAVFCFWKLIYLSVSVNRSFLFAALIDFKSAFPSVDRTLLFKKLAALGMSRKFGCALHSLFEQNTFQLRLSDEVTELFPVVTGLREGSVLSPLLFSIFISDLEGEVLGPFPKEKFLLRDCVFGGVITNGLLFADDLIIFSYSEQGLRCRLKMLEKYVARKKLTVNVGKCEIVPFGCPENCQFQFRFCGQSVPVVRKCKYLGVTFGQNDALESHAAALVAKFRNAVGVFFKLARHLHLSDLRTWRVLQDSLLFSVLYGSEFVNSPKLAEQVELAYRNAVRSYIGVPTQVSNHVLSLLFPGFSVLQLLLKKKCGYLQRMWQSCPTLAPVFFVEDRVTDFPRDFGFSSDLKNELAEAGLLELTWATEKDLVSHALATFQDKMKSRWWSGMVTAASTRFLCITFGELDCWVDFVRAAAARDLATLRIVLLTWTGSVGLAATKQKVRVCPLCSKRLDAKHGLLCGQGPGYQLELTSRVRSRDWDYTLRRTACAYFRLLTRLRPTPLSPDEAAIWEFSSDLSS